MRLIDADALEGRILIEAPGFMDGGSEITKAFILAMIKTRSVTPTIDAVPVVRCNDCKFGEGCQSAKGMEMIACFNDDVFLEPEIHEPDWFCGDGERKQS